MQDNILLSDALVAQPPLMQFEPGELTVVLSSLTLGGAQFEVLDWAMRIKDRWNVHIIALRDNDKEWSVPENVRVTKLHGVGVTQKLQVLGKQIANGKYPVVLAHLLKEHERKALADQGVFVVPVIQNTREGWMESSENLLHYKKVIAISSACKSELLADGVEEVDVIRHLPRARKFAPDARERYRKSWNIPIDATVIGMIGGMKLQKNYSFAFRILQYLLKKRNVYLVILGGPPAPRHLPEYDKLKAEVSELGIRHRVACPGFIPDASKCLPAFDLLLNTSKWEGLGMAILEAAVNGKPVVASRIGGQGEIESENILFLSPDDCVEMWASAIEAQLDKSQEGYSSIPEWARFPSHRQWTLAQLAFDFEPTDKLLFTTINLCSGGAQRSLVNLTRSLVGRADFEVVVTGNSTTDYFSKQLLEAGVPVTRSSEGRDSFDHAAALVDRICRERIGTVVFWSQSAQVKMLVMKALAFTKVRFVDVSPGGNLFADFQKNGMFSGIVSFGEAEYFARLDHFVSKWNGEIPVECLGKSTVIPNGVLKPNVVKSDYRITGTPKIVVNGRIGPTKFVVEIVQAMKLLLERIPNAEMHFYGAAEKKNEWYLQQVLAAAGDEVGRHVFFHGADFEAINHLPLYDLYVVLGHYQGCPNALLEAMVVGLPSIANNNGGSAEQIIHEQTGILLQTCSPEELCDAMARLISDRVFAERLGRAGREHVLGVFSMDNMTRRYMNLLSQQTVPVRVMEAALAA